MKENWQIGGFGLYIHWPFCQSKCPYCDFNSHVSKNVDQELWASAYEQEIERVASQVPNRVLGSIYFGGGTPSLMSERTCDRILDGVRKHFSLSNDIEVTLEANPTSVEMSKFDSFRQAGVNRVSMGIQSLNQSDLENLGRLHSVNEAVEALSIAKSVFDRVSFDLIYARQNQSLSSWEAELTRALDLAGDHISLYQLTIEQGTAFGDRFNRGKLKGLPDEDLSADMYFATQSICEAAGFQAYEVSNHAKNGFESKHNHVYWRGGDYACVGPGAHGRLTLDGTRVAIECYSNPAKWLDAVGLGNGQKQCSPLSDDDVAIEYLMMGLRLNEGIDTERFPHLQKLININKISGLTDLNLISTSGNNLSVTPKGRPVLNGILRELLV